MTGRSARTDEVVQTSRTGTSSTGFACRTQRRLEIGDHALHAVRPDRSCAGLIIEPAYEVATLRPVAANVPEGIASTIGGSIEPVEIDGGSVLWLNEAGKNLRLPTNLLATKIAHRLNGGLYPDDTINGTALVLGEAPGPHGDLVSADVTPVTLEALRGAGVVIAAG